jgi:3,5-epimerase/4-reductase
VCSPPLGSFYSKTKAYVEDMLKSYTGVMVLRVRMPISDDLNSRNFVTKIVHYDKVRMIGPGRSRMHAWTCSEPRSVSFQVVNIPNSMTVLTELLPVSLIMAERKLVGVYNFTNPGAISHNQILALYKKYVDPEYTWSNFTVRTPTAAWRFGPG